jgi:Tol biopolymer transport system component
MHRLEAAALRATAQHEFVTQVRRRARVSASVPLALALVLLLAAAAPAAAAERRFVTTKNPFTVNQAPAWTPDGRGLIFYDVDPSTNRNQIFRARLDGSQRECLTCGAPGDNQFAHYHPSGEWITFHSNRNKQVHVFAPGGGGIGSDLWIMRPDGSRQTPLTVSQEGEDNFHAYVSPDGTRVAWTHIDWALHQGGTGEWDVRVADLVFGADGTPRLENVRVVLPPAGAFYETQHWAPDGSGFLVTKSVGNAMNLELHFYDLATGRLERLTNDPAWDEQAIFTPDGEKVIFMSGRGHPSGWETLAGASHAAGLPPGVADDRLTAFLFPVFFNSPVGQFSNDLYELDLRTRALRRLTTSGDDGWIIPEFSWDPAGKRLLWTQLKWPDRFRVEQDAQPAGEVEDLTAPGAEDDVGRAVDGLSRARPAQAVLRETWIGRYGRVTQPRRR